MTIQSLLVETKQTLSSKSSTPTLDAELLLSFVLNQKREYLITHHDEYIEEHELKHFKELIKKRIKGTPLAYLTEEKEFFGRTFFVDERVLIPRPETEEMLEDAIHYISSHPEVSTLIDLGTGSGCLAISLALQFPKHQVVGLEISSSALEVAKKNADRHAATNLRLIQSDLLKDYPSTLKESSSPVCILANLPYIGTTTNNYLSDETKEHEPDLALFGGKDGLELYRKTWQQIKKTPLKLSALYMEIGFSQAEQMEKEATKAFPQLKYELKNDLAGLPRTAVLSS
ncbi:MAG: peptide chain release factor N(5)-glutamine methyltransferase [Candidatus Gracilibacteria bacterium]|nr:peptide chain release factor N(5)-glutamine methyltransferase [Candidatus Gracilibacteria bacterium]